MVYQSKTAANRLLFCFLSYFRRGSNQKDSTCSADSCSERRGLTYRKSRYFLLPVMGMEPMGAVSVASMASPVLFPRTVACIFLSITFALIS